MKKWTFPLAALSLSLFLFMACQQAVDDMPVPVQEKATSTDPCSHVGVVKANTCGLYVELENGRKIYAEEVENFELKEGAQVALGYRLVNVPTQTGTNSNNSNNGSYGGCGVSDAVAQTQQCMADQSIAQVEFTCIRDNEDSEGNR
ncbi:MAG: hypothetical protein D6722_02420 [Bacteroidetes bacterium]|nr:MAG: hypothetical protein D6722_02420 [Bacteroidota bacterium]